MLKDLVQAFVTDADVRTAFQREPQALFRRFEVSETERKLLLERDEAGLLAALGAPLLATLKESQSLSMPPVAYPGVAEMTISKVEPKELVAGAPTDLQITLEWSHPGLPTKGLPSWSSVEVLRAGKLAEQGNSYCVPTLLDFEQKRALIKRRVTLKDAGDYDLVVRFLHPEVMDPPSRTITVKG